jgi:hypothetical protein
MDFYFSNSNYGAGVAQYGLATDWMTGVRSPAEERDFSSSLCVQTSSWGPPSLLSSEYRGPVPGGEALPGRDADSSPPSSSGVKNE